MWDRFAFFRAEAPPTPQPAAPAPPKIHATSRSGSVPYVHSQADESIIRLMRHIRAQLAAHPYIIPGFAATAAIGYACLWVWHKCCEQQPHIKPAAPSTSSWRSLWSWLPLFTRINSLKSNNKSGSSNTVDGGSGTDSKRRTRPFSLSSASAYTGGENDDDINFVDAAESTFRMFQRRLERTHEAPLRRVLGELESLGERWRRLVSGDETSVDTRHTAEDGSLLGSHRRGGGGNDNDSANQTAKMTVEDEEKVNALRERIRRKAIEADELLTQFIVQLDLAPVGNSAALRDERKALIVTASALADRIAAWMYLPPHKA